MKSLSIHTNKTRLLRDTQGFFVCLLLLKMKNFTSKLSWESTKKQKLNPKKEEESCS